jgi:hypothetical protein
MVADQRAVPFIFGMPVDPNFDYLRDLVENARASCAFLLGSGEESALA